MAGKTTQKPTTQEKPKMGRPSLKTPELLTEILSRISQGMSIVEVCEAEDMPGRDSVHRWLIDDKDFSDNYVRVCKIRREGKFYELEKIARAEPDVNRARLVVDVLKWQLSKEEPKKYGDKIDHTTNGKDLPTPLFGGISAENTQQGS